MDVSWTIKKAEPWKIDAFELWCWRRLLRVPWTARRTNQSILKEISPEYALERLMLKFQFFGHLTRRPDSMEKTLMLGMIEGRRRRGRKSMRWLDGITDSKQALGVGDGRGSLACCSSGVIKSHTWLNDWPELRLWQKRTCRVSYTEPCIWTQTLPDARSSQQWAGGLPQYSLVGFYQHGNYYYIDLRYFRDSSQGMMNDHFHALFYSIAWLVSFILVCRPIFDM